MTGTNSMSSVTLAKEQAEIMRFILSRNQDTLFLPVVLSLSTLAPITEFIVQVSKLSTSNKEPSSIIDQGHLDLKHFLKD